MNRLKFIFIIIFSIFYTQIFPQTLSGTIRDSLNSKPLQGAFVYIPELNKSTMSDNKGYFIFENLPSGNFHVQISYLGYKTRIFNIKLEKYTDFRLNIFLLPTMITTHEIIITGDLGTTQHNCALKVETVKLNENITGVTFSDMLKKIPGVDMISKGGGISSPVIRGLSRNNILVLNNGFRLEDFQFSENHPYFIDDLGNRRIEVVKGSASILYGSDAIGGIINVLPELPPPSGITQISSAISYLTNTQGIHSAFNFKHNFKKLFFGFSFGNESEKDYKDATGTQVINTRFNVEKAKTFIGFEHKYGTSTLYYDYARSKLGLCVAPALKLIFDNYRKNKFFYQDLNHHFLAMKNNFFYKNWKFDFNASYELNIRGLKVIDTLPKVIDMTLNSINYEAKISHETYKWTIISGIQGNFVSNKNNRSAEIKFLPDYQTFAIAGIFYGKYNFLPGFNIQSGVRYDLKNYEIPKQDNFPFDEITKKYENFSASLGLVWDVNDILMFRTNLANAFRTPSVAELAEYGIHGFRYETGNPNLKTQRNIEADFSAHLHTKKFMFDFSPFYNKINNYITLSPTNNYADNGMRIYTYIQKNAEIYGFETSLEWRINKIFLFNTEFNYSLGFMENDYLPLFPQNKINTDLTAFVGKKIKDLDKFFLNLNILYAFPQNRPSEYEIPTPSYFLINPSLGLKKQIRSFEFDFGFRVFNLLNIKYIDHLSTVRDLNFYDQGRNFIFTLKINLKKQKK